MSGGLTKLISQLIVYSTPVFIASPFLIGAVGGFCEAQRIPFSDDTKAVMMYYVPAIAGAGMTLAVAGSVIMAKVMIKRREYENLETRLDEEAASYGVDKDELPYPTRMEKALSMSRAVATGTGIGLGIGVISTIGGVALARVGYIAGFGVGMEKGGMDIGRPEIREIIEVVQPRLAVFGHHHVYLEGQIGATRVIGLQQPKHRLGHRVVLQLRLTQDPCA